TLFNGDDAFVLTKNDFVVDSIGRVGEDPGSEWLDVNDENFSTKERTLRRKDGIIAGDTIADDEFPGVDNQWVVFEQNTADGLGCFGEAACTPSKHVIITEYIEGSGNNKLIEVSNLGDTTVDLHEEGFRLSTYANGRITRSGTEKLYGILVPGSSLVIYNAGAADEFKREYPQGIPSNVTFFNGDDALVLTTNGQVVDSFGQQAVDPGSEWTDASNANFTTKNSTLRRADDVTTGDLAYADAFPGEVNTWIHFEINTSDGVGCAGESACTGNEPLPLEGEGAPTQEGLCSNCPDITKINDAMIFDDAAYYGDAATVSIADFPGVLASKIDTGAGHVQLSYSEIWSVITFADEDPANPDNIIEIYKGDSVAKWMNASGNQSPNPDAWNREHVWSKSHGFPDREQLAYTDAHHLRPADASMNTLRSNLDFDIGGEPIEESPINFKDSDSFEPRDDVKGDVARMMFYMASRYNGADGDNTPDLILVDTPTTESGSPTFGNLCRLYQWHLDDAVDDSEHVRNDVIYEYQGNRNPFIDHPRWADIVYGTSCGFVPTAPVVNITGPDVVNEGDSVTIDGSASSDADGDEITYHWRQLTDGLISFQFDSPSLTFTAPNVSADKALKFELTVSDGRHQTTREFSMVVEANSSSSGIAGGGSLAWLTLLLLPLVATRRRKMR
ncbi:MAG: endonuclease I, partial [Phenylobacterium sp.]